MVKLKKVFRTIFWRHRWEYRNPFDRRCTVCGKHQVKHCWPCDYLRDWWETWEDGDITKHTGG